MTRPGPSSEKKPNYKRLRNFLRLRSLYSILIVVFILLPSCRDRSPWPSALEVTDSAGIQILQHPTLPDSVFGGWTLSEQPSLVLGEEAGEEPYLFSRLRGVIRLSDGRTVVADGGSNELRIFSASGAHLGTAGGTGQGPGEFTTMGEFFRGPGDSLMATNVFERTVSIFAPDGEWARSLGLESAGEGSSVFAQAALTDGSLLVRAVGGSSEGVPREGYYRIPETYLVYSSEGVPLFPLGIFPGSEYQVLNQNGRVMLGSLTMGRVVQSAVADDAVWVGATDYFEIQRFDQNGRLSAILRANISRVPVGDEVSGQWISHTLRRYEDPERVRSLRQRFDAYIWPDFLPVFSDLLGDSDGNLWVQRFRPDYLEGPDLWWVFDVGGQLVAAVETPETFVVHVVGADYVLGLTTDELGVERVVEFRLERSGEN